MASTLLTRKEEGPTTDEAGPPRVQMTVADDTEAEEQDCGSTPVSTSALERVPAEERQARSSVAAAAAEAEAAAAGSNNENQRVKEVCGERRTKSETSCPSSSGNVVETSAAVVAEAEVKPREHTRGAITPCDVAASSVDVHGGHRAAALLPSLAKVSPVSLSETPTFWPVHSDGAGRASSAALGRLSVCESYQPREEKSEEADMGIIESEGANEVWERAMQDNVPAGSNTKKMTTLIDVASKGRREHSKQTRENDGCDICSNTTRFGSALMNMRVRTHKVTPHAGLGGDCLYKKDIERRRGLYSRPVHCMLVLPTLLSVHGTTDRRLTEGKEGA